jgi:hypothetical protein
MVSPTASSQPLAVGLSMPRKSGYVGDTNAVSSCGSTWRFLILRRSGKYWTFVYRPNPEYVSPTLRVQQQRDYRRDVCKVISDAVNTERDAENQAVQPYLEPAPEDESFNRYLHRLARAQAKYFEEHPGAREAHDAREAAGTVVYELRNGRRPRRRDVELAQGFRWNELREGLAGLLVAPNDEQDVE